MDSDLQPHQFSHHFHLPKPQMNTPPAAPVAGGLTRYRSAPSSYFNSFMDAVDTTTNTAADFPPPPQQPRPLSPETESILARFMENNAPPPPSRPNKLYDIPENSPVMGQQAQFMAGVKQEAEQLQSLPPSSAQMMMAVSSMDFPPPPPQMKLGGGGGSGGLRGSSSLVRHRSSPAGLFDDIVIENGYLVNRETGAGNFGSGGRSSNNNTHISFSSVETPMVLPGNSDSGAGGRRFANDGDDDFMTNFGSSSWDDQTIFSGQEMGGGDFNSPENQNREGRNRPPGMLAHHLSLPKASMEKLLQFQDAVPCKIRAKRGCATHPRSIAERVRRTKISERMRKLQDLVPNMDKQTNTSDMLDLAVDYIKDLQTQVKSLSDNRAKCTCTS